MEAVRFTTYDDVELAAHLYLPEGSEHWTPGIIVCHGFASRKERYAEFGERAASAGFAALIPDLRGHGESGGQLDANIFNDIAAAHLYLQNRPEINPMSISIRGTSMGGWLALNTAAYLGEISPIVAYCPARESTMMIIMEEMAMVQRGHPSLMVPENPPRVNVNSAMQLLYRTDTLKAVRRIHPRPLLLVHCEGDNVVPAHVSQRIYEEAHEPKSLWLLPGGDHNFAQHDPATDMRLLDWLKMSETKTGKLTEEDMPAGT
jgi:dienelactone hydrolase